jgi:hypothetical protein
LSLPKFGKKTILPGVTSEIATERKIHAASEPIERTNLAPVAQLLFSIFKSPNQQHWTRTSSTCSTVYSTTTPQIIKTNVAKLETGRFIRFRSGLVRFFM